MFSGTYTISVDAKGRLAVPAKLRAALQEMCAGDLAITLDPKPMGRGTCLFVYPENEFDLVKKKVAQLPSFDPLARDITRLLIGGADEVTMDNSGRVLLSARLREHAGIDKKAVLVGMMNKFELWSEEEYLAANKALLERANDDEELSEAMNTLVI